MRYAREPRWFQPEFATHDDRARLRGERHIVVDFAGQLAEAKFLGRRPSYGMHMDNQNSVDMAFHLCRGSQDTVEAYLEYCWLLSRDLVSRRWTEIQGVAKALIERKRLTMDETVLAASAEGALILEKCL